MFLKCLDLKAPLFSNDDTMYDLFHFKSAQQFDSHQFVW